MGISIIVALPKTEDGIKISGIIRKHGYESVTVCNTAAAVLAKAGDLDCGVVVCSRQLPDRFYVQLAEELPRFFEMLLLTKTPDREDAPEHVYVTALPVKTGDFLSTLDAIVTLINHSFRRNRGPKQRSAEERKAIDEAKAFLMESRGMTETEAFRYIQKTSMDSGTDMAECAQMILMMRK